MFTEFFLLLFDFEWTHNAPHHLYLLELARRGKLELDQILVLDKIDGHETLPLFPKELLIAIIEGTNKIPTISSLDARSVAPDFYRASRSCFLRQNETCWICFFPSTEDPLNGSTIKGKDEGDEENARRESGPHFLSVDATRRSFTFSTSLFFLGLFSLWKRVRDTAPPSADTCSRRCTEFFCCFFLPGFVVCVGLSFVAPQSTVFRGIVLLKTRTAFYRVCNEFY